MTARLRVFAVAAFGVLLVIGMLTEEDPRPLSPTTFGTVPGGYRALYELLGELGFPVTRSHVTPDALAPAATRWWLEARGLCRAPLRGVVPPRDWRVGPWVEAGGTAIVFLPSTREIECDLVAGVPIPARAPAPKGDGSEVTGDVVSVPRTVVGPDVRGFADAADWTVRASIGGRPLVLERPVGAGRVVLVATAVFLHNQWLDHADAAPLAVDLVRAYGVPVFDEHELGPDVSHGAAAHLATSAALPVFLGLALTGLLFAWQGALVPARQVQEIDVGAPRIEAFVDAVAALYARTADHARVFDRYRALTAARLRRGLGLPPETPLATLAERLARNSHADPRAVRLLVEGEAPAGERALRAAVRVLDDLVAAVAR